MPKASEIKKGAAIEHNAKVYFVKDIAKLTPRCLWTMRITRLIP